jgi:hypothetical protein
MSFSSSGSKRALTLSVAVLACAVRTVVVLALVTAIATRADAQISTGGLTGVIKDQQGGVIPGASITLVSETRSGTPVAIREVTNASGEFRFPNVKPDRYTLQVEMSAFKTLKRTGIDVPPGPATSLGNLIIELGVQTEVVTVKDEAPIIQSTSGERSFTVTSEQVAALPINGRDYSTLLQLTPGVQVTTGLGSLNIIGGAGGTNYMTDGVTNMDPGVNREAQKVSVDAIQEVKVLTSSYQAEYGRSSGLQVNAVTKSGSNQFAGSLYDVEQNSKWNANSETNILNAAAKTRTTQRDAGWSVGGPVGRPGGGNKLFFFWNQEYNPRTRGSVVTDYRVPTLAERMGDFSQSLDNLGNLFPYIKDPLLSGTCSAASQVACFKDGGVLGRIPANRLYTTGQNILSWWPLPNLPTTPGVPYNYEVVSSNLNLLGYQPIAKLDYQMRPDFRVSYKIQAYLQGNNPIPGTIPGFNDTKEDNFGIWTHSGVADWTVNQNLFVEASYGRNTHHQEGCSITGGSPNFCTSALAFDSTDNRFNVGMGDLPQLFPNAGVFNPAYKAFNILNSVQPPFWNGTQATPVPSFTWGSRVANAPPNISWPGFILDTVANNFNFSATKLAGAHTLKAGYAFIQSVQRRGNANIQGTYTFSNDTNNPLDTGFGFANADIGVFDSVAQTSTWIEGKYTAINNEAYVQDNWKITSNLTLDYGLRLVSQQPGYDALLAGDNFLPNRYDPTQATSVYVFGCVNGVFPCSGSNRLAMNPVTGKFLGTSGQASIIAGTIVPGVGNSLNGLARPGTDISSTFYNWPTIMPAPRWGAAWDVSGNQHFVVRGGGGIFYDRPSDSNIYTTVNNPPAAQTLTVRYGQLQDLSGAALQTVSPPVIQAFQYNTSGADPMPTSVQWNVGVQMLLPWASSLDVAYTGQHSYNTETTQNINAIDYGAAFNPALQDKTLAPNGVTSSLVNTNPNQVRFYQGYGAITMVQYNGWETYHSLQLAFNRRFKDGLGLGFVDTVGLSDVARVPDRLQHNADGTITVRADQAQAQALLGDQHPTAHQMKANIIWLPPQLRSEQPVLRALAHLINDWQVGAVWTGVTGTAYSIGYTYTSGGANINITGSPDFAGRVNIVGNPGSGCSSDPNAQFNTAAFQGPTAGSVGLESGAGYLKGCFLSQTDLSIARNIKLGGRRSFQLRLDVFNAFNQAGITGRNTTMQLASPSDPVTITNLPKDASGNLIPALTQPKNAGFGVANAYQAPRTMQLQIRFVF